MCPPFGVFSFFGSYLKEGFMHDMKEVESYTADERIASD